MRRWTAALAALLLASALQVAGAALAPSPAGAATFRLVPSQYATIKAAVEASVAGDTVVVSPGTYVGGFDYEQKDVTVVGSGPDSTVIDVTVGSRVNIGPGGTLTGFTVTGARDQVAVETNSVGSVVRGNVFVGNAHSGFGGSALGGGSTSPLVERNRFFANSCDVTAFSGVVNFYNGSAPTLRNNEFVANSCRAVNLSVDTAQTPLVVNNTIVGNTGGIYDAAVTDISGHVFRNNIVWQNETGVEIGFVAANPPPAWDHNLVFDNGTNFLRMPDPAGTDGNLAIDPKLVNAFASDNHLAPGSPAIDTGSSVAAPTSDFDGLARPFDGDGIGSAAIDMGAFEYVPDALPVVSGGLVTTTEGNAGSHTATIAVTLSKPSTEPVSVAYLTLDDTAVSTSDYTDAFGTLVFAPGETSASVSVPITGDKLDEADEELQVVPLLPWRATLGTDVPTIRIRDDDAAPSFTAKASTTAEGDSGGHAMVIPVRLSAVSGRTVMVGYTVVGQTARPDTDFLKKTGVVTFTPGQTRKSVTVWVKGDTKKEPKLETVTVRFSNPVGTWIPASSQRIVGTIVDDD